VKRGLAPRFPEPLNSVNPHYIVIATAPRSALTTAEEEEIRHPCQITSDKRLKSEATIGGFTALPLFMFVLFSRLKTDGSCESARTYLESVRSMIREDSVSRYLLHAMSVLPTPFARLIFLSSMRDHYTGQYLHEGWASASSSEEVNAALGQMHRQAFEVVATLPLIELCQEVRKHFDSLGEMELRTANYWLETEPYYEMIPVGYPQLARKLFISQVRLALEILVTAPTWNCLEASVSLLPQPPDLTHPLRWLN